ncbi:BTB/POZ domain-containing protein [Estrella lausannensis]|uniref:BTB domain-containing protein n=1 Tax=Estrella lausannensis TaxID=483423 RepID=A0A0H5DS19_9BACT|nr:BTB/POZ domain-containing protein [Estrella lausannensis]CRX39058.1 hypothetical protein ELAC_1731 [Estrella lausannensis]
MIPSYSLDLIRLQALYKQCDENAHSPLENTPEELAAVVLKNIKSASPPEVLDTRQLSASLQNLENIAELIRTRQLSENTQTSKTMRASIIRIKALCDVTIAKYAPELLKRLENQFATLPSELALQAAATVCQVGDTAEVFRDRHLSKIRQIISKVGPLAKKPDYADSIEKISCFAKKYLSSEEAAHFFVALKSPGGKKSSFTSSTLIAVSGFFNTLLSGPFQESQQQEITLGEISEKTFEHLALLIRRKERSIKSLSEENLLALLDKATAYAFDPQLIDLCIEAINKRSTLYQLERESHGLTLVLKCFDDEVRNKIEDLLANHPFLSVLIHGLDLTQVGALNAESMQYLRELFPSILSLAFTIPAGEENPETLLDEDTSPAFSQLTVGWTSPPPPSSIEPFFTKLQERGATANVGTTFRLKLKKAKVLSDEMLLKIVELSGHSIRELDLELAKINDATLAAIVASCPNIEVLNLKSCTRLTDTGLQALGDNLTKLRFLSVANPGRGKLSDATLRTIILSNPHLEKLDLSWQSELSGDSIQKIPASLPELKELYLTNCNKIGDSEVDLIAQSCSQLSTLALDFCRLLTKESLGQLFQANNIHCISLKGIFCDHAKWKDHLAPALMTREKNLSLVISRQSAPPTPTDATLLYPAITLRICNT